MQVLASWLLVAALSGCAADRPGPALTATGDSAALAVIGPDTVRQADLPEGVRAQLARIDFEYRRQRQDLLVNAAEQVVRLRLLDQAAEDEGMTRDELIAHRHPVEEIREILGADSLGYLSLEGLARVGEGLKRGFCDACFSDRYPVDVSANESPPQLSLFRNVEADDE